MRRFIGLLVPICLMISCAALAQTRTHGASKADAATSADPTFASQMMQAMDRMDSGMRAAKPTGDPDRDFATMMIPHHQGAIDMAKVQLIYGRDPVLRRLAEAIIVEQKQEIELMRRTLNEMPAFQR